MISYYAIPGLKRTTFDISFIQKPNKQMATEIIEVVAKYYDLPLERVNSKDRHRDLVKVCQVSTWLIYYKMPTMTLVNVAELFGIRYRTKTGYDHSAVIYNRKNVQGMIDVKDAVYYDIEEIKKLI